MSIKNIPPVNIIVMGVSGCGKTTVGTLLAEVLGIPFYDGDDFHPPENVAKMQSGIPLNDTDREPWLKTLSDLLDKVVQQKGCVLACSALKESYRKIINPKNNARFVYLKGSRDEIRQRLTSRSGHFMPPDLLDSQFETLEEPQDAMTISIIHSPREITEMVLSRIVTDSVTNMKKSEIGVFGLGVMGRNLALNLEDQGFQVSVYNRIEAGEAHITKTFMEQQPDSIKLTAAYSLEDFVQSLETPRKILIMVSAGKAVDSVIDQLKPLLNSGDILIDGGNSHYQDTQRRVDELSGGGLKFVGMGVSGGEEGARFGPSLMPGGNADAWSEVKELFQSISAKTETGEACCAWMGKGGAGHFVKMVHNGIEYADMQVIAEVYHLMKQVAGLSAEEISRHFDSWNSGDLSSYLMDITTQIFKKHDDDGTPLVEKIRDAAGQKGTGRWTVISALEHGIPLPIITEAVYSRSISAMKALREAIADHQNIATSLSSGETKNLLTQLPHAMLAGRLMILAEGFFMIRQVSDEQNWDINLAEVAKIWRAGCIIRSSLLDTVIEVFSKESPPLHVLASPEYFLKIQQSEQGMRDTIRISAEAGVPVPALSASLAEFDSLRCTYLPANLIQAQRDLFGAHTYERSDKPEGTFFHSDWNT